MKLWKQSKVNHKSFKNQKRKRFAKNQPYLNLSYSYERIRPNEVTGYWEHNKFFEHYVQEVQVRTSYYRHPQTRNEMRSTQLTEDEKYFGVKIRGRRNFSMLPDLWCERPHSINWGEKNWKMISKRRKQWVPK